MSEAMERPKSVEVGQRWKQMGVTWLVTGVDEARPWPVKAKLVDKPAELNGNPLGYEDWGFMRNSFLFGYEYLGGPSQSQVAAGWKAGQRRRGRYEDASGAMREGEFTVDLSRESTSCKDDWWIEPIGKEYTLGSSARESWGAALLPDAPATNVVVDRSLQTEKRPGHTVHSKPPVRETPASCFMERWDETGPRTALEAIQARQKPEPWRPSVDDFDLLPDVDVRR